MNITRKITKNLLSLMFIALFTAPFAAFAAIPLTVKVESGAQEDKTKVLIKNSIEGEQVTIPQLENANVLFTGEPSSSLVIYKATKNKDFFMATGIGDDIVEVAVENIGVGDFFAINTREPDGCTTLSLAECRANSGFLDEKFFSISMVDENICRITIIDQPVVDEPVDEPVADEPPADEPDGDTDDPPVTDEPGDDVDEPSDDEPPADEPVVDEPSDDEPPADEPDGDTDEPPADDEPVVDEPSDDEPAISEPPLFDVISEAIQTNQKSDISVLIIVDVMLLVITLILVAKRFQNKDDEVSK